VNTRCDILIPFFLILCFLHDFNPFWLILSCLSHALYFLISSNHDVTAVFILKNIPEKFPNLLLLNVVSKYLFGISTILLQTEKKTFIKDYLFLSTFKMFGLTEKHVIKTWQEEELVLLHILQLIYIYLIKE
jgi:hypothetical protein